MPGVTRKTLSYTWAFPDFRTKTVIRTAYTGPCKEFYRPPKRAANETKELANKDCVTVCSYHMDPVCGTDGNTYPNLCSLKSAACRYDIINLSRRMLCFLSRLLCFLICLEPACFEVGCFFMELSLSGDKLNFKFQT